MSDAKSLVVLYVVLSLTVCGIFRDWAGFGIGAGLGAFAALLAWTADL